MGSCAGLRSCLPCDLIMCLVIHNITPSSWQSSSIATIFADPWIGEKKSGGCTCAPDVREWVHYRGSLARLLAHSPILYPCSSPYPLYPLFILIVHDLNLRLSLFHKPSKKNSKIQKILKNPSRIFSTIFLILYVFIWFFVGFCWFLLIFLSAYRALIFTNWRPWR